jgi:site-specific recombinase XerD
VQNGSKEFKNYEKQVVQLWRSARLSAGTAYVYLAWVRRFYSFCAQRDLDANERLTLIGAGHFGRAYSGSRKHGQVRGSSALVAKNALHAWAFSLRTLGVVLPEWEPRPSPPSLPPLIEEYCEFRRCHRGVSAAIVKRDVCVVSMFLSLLKRRRKSIASITASDLDAFVKEQASNRSRKTVATACGSLRSFLRYLHSSGRSARDLAFCIVAPRVRPMEQPVRSLPWRDVKRILGSVDQSHGTGKRDFAMLLMMTLWSRRG